MINNKLFLVLIIIAGLLFSPLIYSKAYSSNDIVSISTIQKQKPPIFITPPVESYCSGSLCLPPGETPASLNLNSLSKSGDRDLYSSTVDNKDGTAPVTGTYDIPVLMVKFPDLQAPSNYTQSIYNDVFNSSNYLNGEGISVSEFYKHNSYDALDITYDVYDWRMMPQNYAYYVNNTHQLVVDAINAFGTGSSAIDFTQYDSDGNGRLDGVVILQAGYQAQENSGSIISQTRIYRNATNWSIQGLYYGDASVIPARHVNTGVCNNWISLFNYPTDCRTSIEIATHEFAHVLGLPDLYAISYTGIQAGPGLGGHTVMVLNGDTTQDTKKPVNFDTWSKFFFGWITPTVINDASQADIYSLSSYDTTDDVYLLQNTSTMGSREFYLITNRYIFS
jgi:M6 family metalloprotease-like protein